MKQFGLPDSVRSRHVYIAGKPGQGKSTILFWMALQDILRGKAVCVLDPNGDLVEDLLLNVPENMADRIIYLDGLSGIPLDFLSWTNEKERDILSDDLLVMFRRFSENWGDRMDAILRYSIYTILEARQTFLDIYRILADESQRKQVVKMIHSPTLIQYWEGQYPHLPKDSAQPITSRMAKFLLTPSLETALGHPHPELRIGRAIEQKKVLLVNLKKMGKEASGLYGSLIVSQIQQAIFRRSDLPREERTPVYLYCDEFQNFTTSAFSVILSEARKFNLGLTLANQFPKQVGDLMEDIRGCVSSYILFNMEPDHARLLKSAIMPYKPEDMMNLPQFRALYHAADGSTNFITIPKPPLPPTSEQKERAERIRKRTIEQYTPPRREAAEPDVEFKRDGNGPFTTNEGKTRGPRRSR